MLTKENIFNMNVLEDLTKMCVDEHTLYILVGYKLRILRDFPAKTYLDLSRINI